MASSAVEIFNTVVVLPPEEREAALRGLCSEDDETAALVRELLAAEPAESETWLEGRGAMADAGQLAVGDVVAGYRVMGRLGAGGMAHVWRVRHESLGTEHALKVLHQTAPEMRARLLDEGRIQARLRHPNLLRVTALVPVSGGTGLVMDLVRGPSLRDLLHSQRMPREQAIALGRGILAGVAYAHSRGLIHRDLKPDNILLEPTDDGLLPRVTDFGLAKALGEAGAGRTRAGIAMGTPGYMAPEQFRDVAGVDARADVYALGCLLYEMLCGVRAFAQADPIALYQRSVAMDFADPCELTPDLPRAFGALLVQALRPRPAERPADAGVLAERWRLAASGAAAVGDDEAAGDHRIARESSSAPTLDFDSLELPTSVDAPPPPLQHNLQPSPDAFFGRDDERAALVALLDEGARLVTLLGPGGVGKTRFSREFGRAHLQRWPGGVWFCDLSEAVSLEGVCAAVAQVLELPLTGGDPVARVGGALAGKGRCLVVLDNFEQVVEHAGETVGRWLGDAPELRLLVTSRVVLELAEERAQPLQPLDDSAAADLFVARARARKPSFALTPESEAAVAELVRLLDGMPLAIELAAARARVMSPAAMVSRIGARFSGAAFKLLSGGRRGARSRQATLRGAIDWSWNLLEDWEQAAFAQCSVFEGGFTLEAAEAVLELSGFDDAIWPMDAVQALVDKSLLHALGENNVGEPRFAMYMSLQEYAAEKLGQGERLLTLRARHAAYFAAFGRPAALESIHVHGGAERWWTLRCELDNLAAATRRSTSDAEAAGHAALAATAVLTRQGPRAAAASLLEAALAAEPTPGLRASLQVALSDQYNRLGRRDEALAIINAVLADAEARGDRLDEAAARFQLGQIRRSLGDVEPAVAQMAQSRALYSALGARRLEAAVTAGEGSVRAEMGQLDQGKALLEAALPLHQAAGNRQGEGLVLGNLGLFHIFAGEMDEGLRKMATARSIAREFGDRDGEAHLLGNIAAVNFQLGRFSEAIRHGEAALALSRALGNRGAEAFQMSNLGANYAQREMYEEARAALEPALDIARAIGDRQLESQVLNQLGGVLHTIGERERGRGMVVEAADIARSLKVLPDLQIALEHLGKLTEDVDDARACLDEALALARELGEVRFVAGTLASLGQLSLRAGDPAGAVALLEEALELAREAGMPAFEGGFLQTLGAAHGRLGALEKARECFDAAEVVMTAIHDTGALDRLRLERGEVLGG